MCTHCTHHTRWLSRTVLSFTDTRTLIRAASLNLRIVNGDNSTCASRSLLSGLWADGWPAVGIPCNKAGRTDRRRQKKNQAARQGSRIAVERQSGRAAAGLADARIAISGTFPAAHFSAAFPLATATIREQF